MIGLVEVEHVCVGVLMLESGSAGDFLRHLWWDGFLEGLCGYGVLISTGPAQHIHVAVTPWTILRGDLDYIMVSREILVGKGRCWVARVGSNCWVSSRFVSDWTNIGFGSEIWVKIFIWVELDSLTENICRFLFLELTVRCVRFVLLLLKLVSNLIKSFDGRSGTCRVEHFSAFIKSTVLHDVMIKQLHLFHETLVFILLRQDTCLTVSITCNPFQGS